MGHELRAMLEGTGPLGYAILGAGVLAVLVCGLALVLGVRRGRRVRKLHGALTRGEAPGRPSRFSPAPELLVVCSTLLLPVLAVITVEHGRGQMLLARTAGEAAMKAHLLAAGVAAQINGLALAGFLMLLQLPLAGTALGFCLGRRTRLGGLRRAAALAERRGADAQEVRAWITHPGPGAGHLLPVTAGIGVVGAALAFGFVTWCTGMIRAFAGVAGVDPLHKAKLLMMAMDEVRPTLERLPPVLGITSVMVAAAAFLLLHVFSPARRRHAMAPSLPAAPELPWTKTLAAAGGCLIVALVSVLLALPYREENLSPLPVKERDTFLGVDPGLTLPALEGPDRLERATVLTVSPRSIAVDSVQVGDASEIEENLGRARRVWSLVNPGRPFPGGLILVADRGTTMGRLAPHLHRALRAAYDRLSLAFAIPNVLERPVLGRVTPMRESAATLRLADVPMLQQAGTPLTGLHRFTGDPPGGGPLLLAPPGDLPYERFARLVVEARRAGREVVLVLEPAGDTAP